MEKLVGYVSEDFEARSEFLKLKSRLEQANERLELFVSTGIFGEFVFLTDKRIGLWEAVSGKEKRVFPRAEISMVTVRENIASTQLRLVTVQGGDEKLVTQWSPKPEELTDLLALVFAGNHEKASEKFSGFSVPLARDELTEPAWVTSPSSKEEEAKAVKWLKKVRKRSQQFETAQELRTADNNVTASDSGTSGHSHRSDESVASPRQDARVSDHKKNPFADTRANTPDFLENKKILQKLSSHLDDRETVEIAIWSFGAGYLLSTQHRLIIAKVSLAQSWMAGSLGGGRVASFYFSDISGIEYNSGLVNGVLEVLTPSYEGSGNKDFWRGSFSGRNANSNDPYTLSNTLPLDRFEYEKAKPLISVIRRRIAEAKGSRKGPDSLGATGLGSIAELSQLHDAGKLTDEEFAVAKARLLQFGSE